MDALDELVAHIEGRYPCVEGMPTGRCQTGDRYVVIGRPTRPESSSLPGTVAQCGRRRWSRTPQAAVLDARKAFDLYARGRKGTLFWRQKPRIEMRLNRMWFVYMRLVITEAPMIEEDAAAFDAWCARRRETAPEERADAR